MLILCTLDGTNNDWKSALQLIIVFYILYFLMIFSVFSAEKINACNDNVRLGCIHYYDETGLPSLLSVDIFLDEKNP